MISSSAYFSTGDDTFRSLYIGEKLGLFQDEPLTTEEIAAIRNRVLASDRAILHGQLQHELGAAAAAELARFLDGVEQILTASGKKQLNVIFLGDCFLHDVRSFVTPLAFEDGITISAKIVPQKNPVDQRNKLREISVERFDLILYSPFTYEFALELLPIFNWRRSAAGRRSLGAMVSAACTEVERTLDLLTELFECPTYVHNTLLLRRHDSTAREQFKNLLTLRARRITRGLINPWLAEAVSRRQAAEANLVLFDETRLLDQASESALGRLIHGAPFQHPAELGRTTAQEYREILAAHADLVGKKVVVCDLDNTLWSGVIGEGAVDHFHHAQRTLKELRRRGVLLAVNSKNDPRNVNWTGAALGPDDFVSMEINWDPKVVNMRRIQAALNLKFKDFVFIDDRPDERAQVKDMFPEIQVLDATSERTWKQLARWAGALAANPDSDRTQQYREREQREQFISAVEPEDQTAVWTKLEIKTEVRFAAPAELKRVTELINRTNQFNLAGSRTSLKEVRRWHNTPGKRVVVVDAADKFGPMGLIAALLVDLNGPEIQIPVFVLSCRVFGYGIENAVLGAIKRLAVAAPEVKAIRGDYRETPHNEPCRKLYPDNGFCREGDSWVLRQIEVTTPPAWLTVTDRLSPQAVSSGG